MGLMCSCPPGATIPNPGSVSGCKSSMGQLQKILIHRQYRTVDDSEETPSFRKGDLVVYPYMTGSTVSTTSITKRTGIDAARAATDDTKIIATPFLNAPSVQAGNPITFGGGNDSRGGIEVITGSEPTTCETAIYQLDQAVIKELKKLMCEDVAFILVDEYGNLGLLKETDASGNTSLRGIPVSGLFVGDKTLGQLQDVDKNAFNWKFLPNWSDDLVIIPAAELDYKPLDLDNYTA